MPAAVLVVTTLLYAAQQTKNPVAGQITAIQAGQTLFRGSCAVCHGSNAEGGRGPSLNNNPDIKRMTDGTLFHTIRKGISGTEMPASSLPDNNIWELAAYIRALNTPAFQTPVEGDVAKGQAEFFGPPGCSSCHMIRGNGGFIGPDLTNIGVSSTVNQIRESILHPDPRMQGFIGVTVVLKNGKQINGVAKNNSNYSIQVLSADGHLHLLNKSDLKQVKFATKSLMPGTYGQTLSPGALQNLVAFLSRQSIRPPAKTAIQGRPPPRGG